VLFAPVLHGLSHELGNRALVAGARSLELPEAGGVDVQRLDGQMNLAVEAPPRIVVQAPGGLGQCARRLENAVSSVGAAEHLAGRLA
jgi:hypothetical protein